MRPQSRTEDAHFSRILLVRLRQIGDVVFTTPAVRALRQRFPDAHLTYIVEPAAEAVVAKSPHLDEVDVAPPDPARDPVEMTADPQTATAVAARLARAGVGDNDRLIVLHVSAGNPFRTWPIAAFAALVALLVSKDPRRRVVVTSGPTDR